MSNREKLDLIYIKDILNVLDNPHLRIPPVIHVSGTNGKGSVCAYIFSILSQAGYSVHRYTSPHLLNVNERIVLSGNVISDKKLFDCLERVRLVNGSSDLCFFEAITIAAFIAFSEVKADFLVMEVGMGGLHDATNVVQNTILSIITSISFDHSEFLGFKLEEIAYEKSGIMRRGVPCVVAKQFDCVMNAITSAATSVGSLLFRCGFEWNCSYTNIDMKFSTSSFEINFPRPGLLGDHQIYNSCAAIAAINILNSNDTIDVYVEDIENGILNVNWPARIMPIYDKKILSCLRRFENEEWSVFIDGAHNEDGARVLSEWMGSTFVNKQMYLIVGLTKKKDIKAFISNFAPFVKVLCAVCVNTEVGAYAASDIQIVAESIGFDAFCADSIVDAMDIISNISTSAGVVVITGSLYLLGDVEK
uniref:Mur ligase central domain-containing protein n=1 Tax=Biomphalaria glabrata TaxID=6526 RepID=A0A2C9LUU2_BIOGL